MLSLIHSEIKQLLLDIDVAGDIAFSAPPKPEMGDIAFGCFALAKEQQKNPAEVAKEISLKLQVKSSKLIEKVMAFGPYVNFFLRGTEVVRRVVQDIEEKGGRYGTHTAPQPEKILLEFACLNTNKPFHIGHLRNIVTGESVARIAENMGHHVIRTSYGGDVGMHIAKSLWGIQQLRDEYETLKNGDTAARAEFLGRAYAKGGVAFGENETAKAEITALNKRVYAHDSELEEMLITTKRWSLEYFATVYARLDTHFDRLYYESEVAERGTEIVRAHTPEVFTESEGAIIFPGSTVGLHDRVFINSLGLPTYEAKEVALAELQRKEFAPDKIWHVVGKEQSEYFKVLFAALGVVFPDLRAKEFHIPGGFVRLKYGKMSSRTGDVILGDWLITEVEKNITELMRDVEVGQKEAAVSRLALAAIKYGMLKLHISHDIAFDLEESVQLSGDSGPYLLYIVARIKSILRKATTEGNAENSTTEIVGVHSLEKQLAMRLASFPSVTARSGELCDPSEVAKYLLSLAQDFNTFYQECPILKAEGAMRLQRLRLSKAVSVVMERGLFLLGIHTVEQM